MTAPAPPIQHLTSTQDLLLRLQLLPSYDKYVRPYVHPLGTSHQSDTLLNTNVDSENSQTATGTVETPMTGHVDKGKGRAVPIPGGDVEIHDAHDADEDDAVGKGEKKWKNSYKHLIKGIPGSFSAPVYSVRCGFELWLTIYSRKTFHQKRRLSVNNHTPSSKAKAEDTSV